MGQVAYSPVFVSMSFLMLGLLFPIHFLRG